MKIEDIHLDKLFSALEKDKYKIVGIYEQGSTVWGFADENSDRDLIVIWENNYPSHINRQKSVLNAGGIDHEFKNIQAIKQGVDMFEIDNKLINVGHIRKVEFFDIYKNLKNSQDYYQQKLLQIGGFVNALIHYDPDDKLKKYQEEIKLTREIVEKISAIIKIELEYDLKLLTIAARRRSTLRFFWQLYEVLNHMHIYYYLEKSEWVMSMKWFEKFAEKNQWNDEFTDLIFKMQSNLDFDGVSDVILKVAKQWGFKPAVNHKA